MSDVRLIDANALEARAYEIYVHASPEFKTRMNTLKELIDQAPTIEAEPVRHGRWGYRAYRNDARITVSGEVVCSNCHAPYFRVIGTWFKYCPHCGAKMDGGVGG